MISHLTNSEAKEKIYKCPHCSEELLRVSRSKKEKIFNTLLLGGALKIKRFYCYRCGWEGTRNRFD